ncbi:PLC-like phosphodiesterase [Polychaeton citri CBS 116435]|uniref:PLC-like phosphodiesterase n=1 Tax=Polychaeton citri CBS 116435 TaxID=1314669 RepID=A0A9P4URH7_9PEZI|nr:PLC-like phosphodiesterase [Polychaeton citri CBS 116435]
MRAFLAAPTLSTLAAAWPALLPRQTACNGNAAYCSRRYSSVSLIGTHDSAFVGSLIDPTVNQGVGISDQLDAGIRFLQSQTHKDGDTLKMCHTSCDLQDAGPVADYLATVKTWLDGHPSDVVTILLTNGDNADVSEFGSVLDASGLKDYAFVPPSSPNALAYDDWPNLEEMISDNKRLVFFLDYGADTTKVPYILDEFAYFWETHYDVTDENFSDCSIDRPPNSSPDGRMSIVNHFLDTEVFGTGVLIPDNTKDYRTNAATGAGSIGAQADLCKRLYDGKTVNVVLVDRFDMGDVFTAQDALNGV